MYLFFASALTLPTAVDVQLEEEITPSFDAVQDVVFILHTRNYPTGQIVNIDDMSTVRSSYFSSSRRTKVLIHGMFGDRYNPTNTLIYPAYLQAGDFNVFVVDWGLGASTDVIVNGIAAGVAIARFLDNLNNDGLLNFNDLTLVGHSMGAHVAGFAAKNVSGRINTIIGLDAANIGNINDPTTRLDSSDAEYVELIQTEILFIAMSVPVGHANFYPNGGMNQPACGGDFECNHMKAIDYFAESLRTYPSQFYAQSCSSMDQMRDNACPTTPTRYLMGGEPSNYAHGLRGIFRVPVNAQAPYAVGQL